MDAETKEAVRQLFHIIVEDYIGDKRFSDSAIDAMGGLDTYIDKRFAAQGFDIDEDDNTDDIMWEGGPGEGW